MAFVTLEDLTGSVEVLVFPKDYEKKREYLNVDEKIFIRGRASIGEEPVGKLICEQVLPFAMVPRELWLKYPDKETYLTGEKELLDTLRMSEGNDTVVIYLEKERAKKVLPKNWNVKADLPLLETLQSRLGESNVKLVEKAIGKFDAKS